MKNATFEEKLMYVFDFSMMPSEVSYHIRDCEMVLKSMNETISWFGETTWKMTIEKMGAALEGHPSVNEEHGI